MNENYPTIRNNSYIIRESRDIKVTSKRQITIPKTYFDYLGIKENVHAYLLDDAILIKADKKQSQQEIDLEIILKNIFQEGFSSDEIGEEFSKRVKAYNKVLNRKVNSFVNDMTDGSEGELKGDDFNGLDIFFDEENGENS